MAELELPPTVTPESAKDTAVEVSPIRETLLNILVFLGQRLLYAAVVLLFIIFLSYFGIAMAGGVVEFGTAVQEAILDTLTYIGNLLQGDMGTTTAGSNTLNPLLVTDVIKERLPRSLGLLAISLLFASIVGLFLGIRAARSRSESSLFILLATIIGISVPSFFAAFLLQWGVTTLTRMRGQALLPVGGFGWDNHLILPVLVLAARPIAQITRVTFISLRNVLRQDYVRTAYSKGLRQYQITFRHILRNAAIPILTTIGISLSFALSMLPIVELYFGWPGVGVALLKGIAQQDANLIVGLALCFGAIFIFVNMLLELSYRFIDPRLWEKPSYVTARERHTTQQTLSAWRNDAHDILTNNAITHWIKRRRQPASTSPFGKALKRNDVYSDNEFGVRKGARSPWAAVYNNMPFVIGGLLVLLLVILILFGPNLSPNNPYRTEGLVSIDGQISLPPFAPNETYPWGSDALGRGIMSLVLSGAQTTLTLAILAVAARALLGITLGAIAGWRSGSWLDRAISGLAEVLAAFPTLILTMILILAIGIRQGMSTFVWALGLVGWGEIMRFVRGEVMGIRPKQYIESAIALGARSPRVITHHILPQLVSTLVAIIALEMGSVLMLLGELGFISIFVGGGAFIELPGVPAVLYSDVPEWGALLSNVRYLARSYPWTALYPMLAFFVAIFAFNLFGEGIRRMVDNGNLIVNRLFNRYTLMAVVLVIVAISWLQNNSGSVPFLRDYAQAFSGAQALTHVQELTAPQMNGRSLGTPGQAKAAQYIADQFEAFGLQAGGQAGTYFQERTHSFERLISAPQFTINDGGPALVYGQDYTSYPGRNMSAGEAAGTVRFVGLGNPLNTQGSGFRSRYPDLDRIDFSENILLAVSDRDAANLSNIQADGLLVVADDPANLGKAYTLSGRSGRPLNLFTGEVSGEETPSLWISENVANRLLASSSLTVADLRRQTAQLGREEVLDIPLSTAATMQVEGEIEESWPVQHVIGLWPGSSGFENCQTCLDTQLVVVMAQYDSPPPGADGLTFPAANDNASGVAVMLEAIRMLQESGYKPNRSLLFVAYSGEGLDGGEPVSNPEIKRFLQAKTGFAASFEPEAIIRLRGLGAGTGDQMEVSAAGSLRLAELFETSAKRMGTDVMRAEENIDIGLIYEASSPNTQAGTAAPSVLLQWEGWEQTSRLAGDTPERISEDKLQRVGRALALALMTLGLEVQY